MADYFPLISRAVSALDPNTPERRETIYARAREALVRQLQSLDPPIAEVDLRREQNVLDETILRVEASISRELAGTAPQKPDRIDPADEKSTELPAEAAVQALRPKVTRTVRTGLFGSLKAKTAAVVAVPLLLLIAITAYVLRDDPGRYNPANPAAPAEGTSASRKSEGRLDGTGGAGPVVVGRPVAQTGDSQALPVASRVLFFEESPGNPQGVQSDGIVIWRADPGAGPPALVAIRGSVTVSKANMALEFVIRKNTDASLSASHTIEVVFKPEAGRDGVKELGPIEMRDVENQPGFSLQGAQVPVATNLFLIGLDKTEATLARNVEAIRDKKWIAFQFRMTNNRIGAVLMEKGATGDKAFTDVLAKWQ